MAKAKYQGVYPAFYACYEQGEVSAARCRQLAAYFLAQGLPGLYVGGSSGECIYQSVADRKLCLEAVMAEVGDKMQIIAHVACNNTRDSQELARHAEQLGVAAIAAIPPIYFRLGEAAIAAYWNDISAAAPQTDFIIYNIPQLAGVALTPSLFSTMLSNPRVVGVKNSSMPVQDIQTWKSMGGADFSVFNGPDEQFVGGRVMGADGGIGGTYGVMPELFLHLDELVKAQNMAAAFALQARINEIIATMLKARGNLYAVLKQIIAERIGLDLGGVRSPLPNLCPGDEVHVQAALQLLTAALNSIK